MASSPSPLSIPLLVIMIPCFDTIKLNKFDLVVSSMRA